MKLNIFILCFFYTFILFAQDVKTKKLIIKDKLSPDIPFSDKIKETIDFSDTTQIDKVQEYDFIDSKMKLNYVSRPLSAAKIKEEKNKYLSKRRRIILAGGSHGTSQLNILTDLLNYNNLSTTFSLSNLHRSFEIEERDAGLSNFKVNTYVKGVFHKHILFGDVTHERSKFHIYGIPNSGVSNYSANGINSAENSFIFSKLQIKAISKNTLNTDFKHQTHFYITDLNRRSENRIHLSTILRKDVKSYPVTLDLSIDNYIHYNRDYYGPILIEKRDVKIFQLNPSTEIVKNGIDMDFGLGFRHISDEENSFDIFPEIRLKKELSPNILTVYSGLISKVNRNTYKTLFDINPYINSYGVGTLFDNNDTLDLRNTNTKELFFSISNVLGKEEVIDAGISMSYIQNSPSFYNDFNSPRFLVEYQDIWELNANIDYRWNINHLLGFKLNADYYYWSQELISKREDFILQHRSNIEADASIFVNFEDKINLKTSFIYFSKKKVVEYPDIVSYLPSRFNIGINLDYNYNDAIGGFIHLNNITNSRKYIWQGYKEIGINLMLGFGYSF